MEDIKQYWFVIRELTGREIKRKYARSYLGILWSVLSPLLFMLVMSLLFSTMFKRSIEHFPLYFLVGHLVWDLHGQVSTSIMTVLVDNKILLMKTKVPKNVFILSRCYTAFINYLFSLVPLFPLMFIFRVAPSWKFLLFPIGMLFGMLFSLGLGYILSVLYVFFADVKYLYRVVLTIWMYMSALFYPIDRVPPAVQLVIYNNPIYDFAVFCRDCMLYGKIPEIGIWIRVILWGIFTYLLGYLIFRTKENEIMKNL